MSFLSSLFGANPHSHSHPRVYRSVLFVLKKLHKDSAPYSHYNHPSSGLANSARFVRDMLVTHGVRAHLVEVIDGNCIDREVMAFDPDVVILEAIWCPPAKLAELSSLHRHKRRAWVVRNHSELPFLSMEGIAVDWMLTYPTIPRVHVSCNSPVAAGEVEALLRIKGVLNPDVILTTNYYPVSEHIPSHKANDYLDVGCFGAIRPLKNHLEQAVAAVLYARSINRPLRFHINATRIEGRADPVLKSMRALFKHTPNTTLVEHGWLTHREFLGLCRAMDIGLQVSFSETFNIVAADLVNQGVPVVASAELPWMPEPYIADPTSALDIVDKMAYASHHGASRQREALKTYAHESEKVWLKWLRKD